MKRRCKKRLPTRRGRALRRIAVLAAVLAYLTVFRLYAFLPVQARYESEERANTGRTELVIWQEDDGSRLELSVKGDTLLLTRMDFQLWRGWDADRSRAWDCPPEEPVAGKAWTEYGEETEPVYLVVRISDPAVQTLELSIQHRVLQWEEPEERREVLHLRSSAEEWVMWDGCRYLLAAPRVEVPRDVVWADPYLVITALDQAGNVTATYDSYEAEMWG